MKTFRELFTTILTGDKKSSRKAARAVRKVVYSAGDNKKYLTISSIITQASLEYAKIMENWRQENFVMAISVMYFLGNKRDKPDFLFLWLIKLLRHENGNIRYAAARMLEIEFGPLTYHIRCPGGKSSILMFSPQQADLIILELFSNLSNLLTEFWAPRYKKYKYISSLPNGVYKSVQLVLDRLKDLCGNEYFDRLQRQIYALN